MTRFIHDKFAKDYLEELLKDYGEVKSSEKVSGEIKEIDVLFTPDKQQNSNLQILGLLGRFAEHPAILEPFRNPASTDEICDCILKLLEIKALVRREGKANKTKVQDSEIPKLWVLTPTISETRLSSFGTIEKAGWLSGVHFLPDALRTAIVAIHQLPQTPETLWLRLLGRGSVQSQAIVELQALPLNHPYQKATLELVYNLRENLKLKKNSEVRIQESESISGGFRPATDCSRLRLVEKTTKSSLSETLRERFSGGLKPLDLSAFSFKIHSEFWLLTPEFCFGKSTIRRR